MYVSGLDRDSRRPLFVARKTGERREQRLALEGLMLREQGKKQGGRRRGG
jgi:hypothetical protein